MDAPHTDATATQVPARPKITASQARIERLMECWRVLCSERDNATWRNDARRLAAIETAMRIVDACVSIEEGFTTSDNDRAVLARLREIAAERDIFKVAPAEGDAAEQSA